MLFNYWYFALNGSFVYKYILSISAWLFIKFNNAFVFPDPEPPIISILYGWSGIYGHFKLYECSYCSVSFSFVYSLKLISCILLSISLSHTLKEFVPYGYVVILSNSCNLFLSLLLGAILLICSIYTLRQSLLNLYCDFSMILSLSKQSI